MVMHPSEKKKRGESHFDEIRYSLRSRQKKKRLSDERKRTLMCTASSFDDKLHHDAPGTCQEHRKKGSPRSPRRESWLGRDPSEVENDDKDEVIS